jgi:small multidrug resistance family-3 protein
MSTVTTLSILVLAAFLEVGGDALVRRGLQTPASTTRLAFIALGGIVLWSYGYVVNTSAWDFGRLLGVYVVVFFVVAQLISWLAFGQPPSRPVLIGGLFLIVGGGIMSA